jgi:hypothetical protein
VDEQRWRRCAPQDAGETGAQHLAAAERRYDPQRGIRAEHEPGQRGAAHILVRNPVDPGEIVADRARGIEQAYALIEQRICRHQPHLALPWA